MRFVIEVARDGCSTDRSRARASRPSARSTGSRDPFSPPPPADEVPRMSRLMLRADPRAEWRSVAAKQRDGRQSLDARPADLVPAPARPARFRRARPPAGRRALRLRPSGALHATTRPCRRLSASISASSRLINASLCNQRSIRARRALQRTPARAASCALPTSRSASPTRFRGGRARQAATPMARPASPAPRSARASAPWCARWIRRGPDAVHFGLQLSTASLHTRDAIEQALALEQLRRFAFVVLQHRAVRSPTLATLCTQQRSCDRCSHTAMRSCFSLVSRSKSAVALSSARCAAMTRGHVGSRLTPPSCG